MLNFFQDAFLDTLKTVPWLLLIYVGIELVEYKFGNNLREKVQQSGKIGPLLGASAGLLPQCGFSVIGAALYSQKLITIGTLLAVFLATSDEALPIILSDPQKTSLIWPLLLTKFFLAVFVGFFLDFIFRKNNQKTLQHIHAYAEGRDEKSHDHHSILEEKACCGHLPSHASRQFKLREIFLHPLSHTLKIFFFIFLLSFFLSWLMASLSAENLARLFLQESFWQPFLVAALGILPNCAASVAVTELYLNGIISFGSVIAGLSASGGLGILILFKEEKNKKAVFQIIGLLFGISVIAGIILQYFEK
jgi:hypothetical protein